MSSPLIFGGQVLGVLDVQSDKLNAFGEKDRFLFAALAEHIAIAMRNAYLYRSETWRRQVADSLREVAGLLSADLDLDQVLEAVLTELERTLPLDVAAIWLLSESSSDEDSGELPNLHLAAVRGAGTFDLELEIGLLPEEVLEYNLDTPDNQKLEQASAWLNEALRSDVPVTRSPSSPFDPLGAALDFPADYSAIAAPLRVGERLLGVLTLAHRTAGRYGGESQTMTAAFASYASVALENTRLYEDAHEQAWVSTVLLQVAEATQSVTNLTELLDTVIRITPMLAGVKACLLYILDEDGTFVPAAASGLSADQQAEFERWRFAPGDVTALDRLMEEHSPVILHEGQEDARLLSILSTSPAKENSKEMKLPVLVPLLARGEVLGVFLVDYSTGLPTMEMGKSLEAFFDERLAILQGIAHQTAVAVDNIRLLKAQKEEAYVSVALLQVAQAVVSSNDLEEALGSIVRITPILVGVNRAIIYLWNELQHTFHMSQAYGIARSTGGQSYAIGEFPLLDAALLEDSLVACPLQYGESNDDVPAAWTRLEVPNLDRIDDYLKNATSLLIAFPLAMKGKVLGIFLVEEPEPVPGESFSSGNANRRLRSKRLEIITGISQQAALAIQNDLLQKEMVERERLEREMQLAREIQRAFLPHSLPELPGWDIQVKWRPARQVGGDFYDFFELPEGRFGLVIADVADKGMPAALFMTLVRTLVRATVRDLASPAAVLRRVNNLIVPDATGGMFVTLAFAVLDLKTGELTIANAGHNPPLWLRRQGCQLENIQRTGMALGVLEDNPFEERTCQIAKGDFLILYTDGVTDAFSPRGDDFGEQRLRQAVNDSCQSMTTPDNPVDLTALQMLDAIDQQVVAFVADAVPSDDLTLLVLKRLRSIKKDRRTWGGHARQSKEGHRKRNTGDVLKAQTGD
jgi:serine phosphatase RsbU (regulator of sigma subunit)